MKRISELIETLVYRCSPEFISAGGMYVDCVKEPEYMPKDLFVELCERIVNVFSVLTPETHYIDQTSTSNLLFSVVSLIDFFKSEVSSIDLFLNAESSFTKYIDELNAPNQGLPFDPEKLQQAGDKFLHDIRLLVEDVYSRNFVIPPHNPPPPTDKPISFPPPDPFEMGPNIPSRHESRGNSIDWPKTTLDNDVTRLLEHIGVREKGLTGRELLKRLWGYSHRVCSSNWNGTNRQRSRIPRFAMYPYYCLSLGLCDGLFKTAEQYRTRELKHHTGSHVIMPTMDQTFPLARLMKSLLMYAPREYFQYQSPHHLYLNFIRTSFEAALDAIIASLPKDSRIDASKAIASIKRFNQEFFAQLQAAPAGSEISYSEKADAIVKPFADAFIELAGVLRAVEENIRYEAEHPEANQESVNKRTLETADAINALPKLFKPKDNFSDEDARLVLNNQWRVKLLKNFKGTHLQQMLALVSYTLKNPVSRPGTKNYDKKTTLSLAGAIKKILANPKWKDMPDAWQNDERGYQQFKSSAYGLTNNPDKDPFNYAK